MDLAKLATVLQGAKEGSEYLDYAIQRVLFGMAKPVPEYTRSLDAAMQLVEPGWSIHRLSHLSDCKGGFAGWVGDIYRAGDAMIPFPVGGTSATAPLALCNAVLRVRLGELLAAEEAMRTESEDMQLQRSGT
jgi:hypothetical protein